MTNGKQLCVNKEIVYDFEPYDLVYELFMTISRLTVITLIPNCLPTACNFRSVYIYFTQNWLKWYI